MKLFPYILLRQASGKISELESFNSVNFKKYLSALEIEERTLCKASSKLISALHNIISSANETDKLKLVKAKRKIYNLKPISPSQKDILFINLDQQLKEEYEDYERLILSLFNKNNQFYQLIEKNIQTSRDTFRKLIQNDNLINGLFFSSSSMFDSAHKYLDNETNHSKKSRQIEKSLLKYLLRIYTRSTPFSSFAHFQIKSIASGQAEIVAENRKSHIKLNPRLLYILHEELCSIKDFYWNFPIRLNRNAVESDKRIMAYAIFTSRNESFNSVDKNPIFDYLFETLKEGENEKVRVPDLIQYLEQVIDTPSEEIEYFLISLIDAGFIVFDSPLSTYDKNVDKLRIYIDFLQKTSKGVISAFYQNIITLLVDLNEKIETIEPSSSNRYQSLIACKSKIESVFNEIKTYKATNPQLFRSIVGEDLLKKELKSILNKTIFYEDVTANIKFNSADHQLNPIIESLNALYSGCINTPSELWEMCNATALFCHLYEKEREVDLLTFFEQYNRYFLNDTYKEDKQLVVLIDKTKEYWRTKVKSWNSQLEKAANNFAYSSGTVNFDRSFFDVFEDYSQDISPNAQYGAYLNFYDSENNSHKVVLESTTSGYGRMFSRFLNYYDKEVLDRFRKENNRLENDKIIPLENFDGFNYSINDRPKLMMNKVEANKIVVRYDHKENKLHLIDKETNKQCEVYNLDFLTPGARSKLYQFLIIFDPAPIPYINDISDSINSKAKEFNSNGIVTYPRIVFEKKIVIQRKKWVIPSTALPKLGNTSSTEEKIIVVYKWVKDINIPDQVFVKLNRSGRLNRNLGKSQYINIKSPFIVRLLVELIEKCLSLNEELIIEEMLPSPDYITDNIGDHTTELLVQWSKG